MYFSYYYWYSTTSECVIGNVILQRVATKVYWGKKWGEMIIFLSHVTERVFGRLNA